MDKRNKFVVGGRTDAIVEEMVPVLLSGERIGVICKSNKDILRRLEEKGIENVKTEPMTRREPIGELNDKRVKTGYIFYTEKANNG